MKTFDSIGVQVPQILLPRPDIDLTRWAVIAVDQFTSQPEYWAQVERIVGDAPSTFNLVLPEVYLSASNEAARIQKTQAAMRAYMEKDIFTPFDGMIYVERSMGSKKRRGLMLALDLEKYDYNKGSTSLVRASEGTILERLPPRIRIREGASLELPHILVLIDDPQCSVIEPLERAKARLPRLYDFELMLGSGHLSGYGVTDPGLEDHILAALQRLADPETFQSRYGLMPDQPVMLFAMGDGNHSLATAKAIWEKIKPQVGPDHPARFALVEIENVHDEGLQFEPIHRVLFEVKTDLLGAMRDYFGAGFAYHPVASLAEMAAGVDQNRDAIQRVGLIQADGFALLEFKVPSSNLAVGTLQPFLDAFLKDGKAGRIDYVHGEEVAAKLGAQMGNAGFYLPAMPKSDLFKTVILDGALPRKTFSMGEAQEKRFYLEARKIVP
jgi:hypothetical protein